MKTISNELFRVRAFLAVDTWDDIFSPFGGMTLPSRASIGIAVSPFAYSLEARGAPWLSVSLPANCKTVHWGCMAFGFILVLLTDRCARKNVEF